MGTISNLDEVDKIIIHSLNDIGCDIDDSVDSLRKLSTDMTVEAAVRCIELIDPSINLPKSLPQNMASRHYIGASLAEACRALGYTGEVGYQTFLYSNDTEVRRVFMFLIEMLPRESEKTLPESYDSFGKLKLDIGKSFKEAMNYRWKPFENVEEPFISVRLDPGIVVPTQRGALSPQGGRDVRVNELKFLTEQTQGEFMLPSIIALCTYSLIEPSLTKWKDLTPVFTPLQGSPRKLASSSNSWLSMKENLLFNKSHETQKEKEKEELLAPSTQSKVHELEKDNLLEVKEDIETKEEIARLKDLIDDLKSSIKLISSNLMKVKEVSIKEESELRDKVKAYEVHRMALQLLSDPEDNINKLNKMVESANSKLISLALQWETHRVPLIESYRHERLLLYSKATEYEKRLEKVNYLNQKVVSTKKDIARKEASKVKLQEEYDKLPKDINRSAYTRRIMEIIGNTRKQKDMCDKILKDLKSLQKEMNTLTERVDRTFMITDETIFRNAKKDEYSKKAYKLLATLHADFCDIVTMVKETGSILREKRDCEEQIEIETTKNVSSNLERIYSDWKQMEKENSSLRKQLDEIAPLG